MFDAVRKVLRSAAETPWELAEDDLAGILGQVQALTADADAARVGVVREALDRGVATDRTTAASPTDWVCQSSPGMAPPEAARVVRVAQACRLRSNEVLTDAVLAATVSIGGADVVIKEFGRLEPDLTLEAGPTVLAGFVQVAASEGPRQIRALRERIIAEYGRPGTFQARQDRARRARGLSLIHI